MKKKNYKKSRYFGQEYLSGHDFEKEFFAVIVEYFNFQSSLWIK